MSTPALVGYLDFTWRPSNLRPLPHTEAILLTKNGAIASELFLSYRYHLTHAMLSLVVMGTDEANGVLVNSRKKKTTEAW